MSEFEDSPEIDNLLPFLYFIDWFCKWVVDFIVSDFAIFEDLLFSAAFVFTNIKDVNNVVHTDIANNFF